MARSHGVLAVVLCAGLWAGAPSPAWAQTQPAPSATQPTDRAIEDAREKLRQEILATEIEPGQTVGALLREKGLEQELNRQLEEAKPVGGARWLDERSCQVRLELPGQQVAEIIAKASAGRAGDRQIATETVSRMTFISVGHSGGHAPRMRIEADRKLVPQQAPEWVNRTLSAEAWSRASKSPLMAAQAAEADARKALAERVGTLVLAYNTTLQHAGEIDSSIAEATARGLNSARVRRTDYGPDGSAKVRVEINLRNLWDELNR